MRTSIATVSLSGLLPDKLAAAAAAGFDGVEIFDNDLVACPLTPREVRRRCEDLGLSIELFQPVRDVEGLSPERFDAAAYRFRRKLEVMEELGATRVLVCSNVAADAVHDLDLTAEQLHRLGELAADSGVTLAFEALAWGRHIDRAGQAWDAVTRADHPAVTLAVDTFHMLSRGDGPEALRGVPGDRIGFLQVADAPLLDMNLLEWSRHFRCFPGQGAMDVAGIVAAVVAAGYDGPLSLEVFSDVVRRTAPVGTARDGMRSLRFLEDQLARSTPELRDRVSLAPPASERTDPAFVELSDPLRNDALADLLGALGFRRHGRHRSKAVTWWRNGDAHLVVNQEPGEEPDSGRAPRASALGVRAAPVAGVAARAEALLWPAVDTRRGAGEALLPGITSPSGLHVFVSAQPGSEDHWQCDFLVDPSSETSVAPGPDWLGLDHLVLAVPATALNEEVAFFRTLFALRPGALEEFMEPQGQLRSRALRPEEGDLRVVLNVEDLEVGGQPGTGVTQLAFGTPDAAATVTALRAAGVPLMEVPANYYDDLDARFALPPEQLDLLRRHQLLYDRAGDGELLHAYTQVLEPGFVVEVLERRGGYDAYGSANTHVRLAALASTGSGAF